MFKSPKPGDIGLARISGLTGWLVGLGQFLCGDSSRYTHCYIVLDNGNVMAGQPGGARQDKLSLYDNQAAYLQMDLTDEQRRNIVIIAKSLEETPYGWFNYLAIGLARFNIRPKWLTRYIASNKTLICSQLVDLVYERAGIHLFNDGRPEGLVTPGDLSNWIIDHDWKDLEK